MKRIIIGSVLCMAVLCMAIISWTMEEGGGGGGGGKDSSKRRKVEPENNTASSEESGEDEAQGSKRRKVEGDLAVPPVMRNGGYKKFAIPVGFAIQENGIAPQGKIEAKELFLNMNESDPLLGESYSQLLEDKNGLPLLVGLVTTNDGAGRPIYNVYEASLLRRLVAEGRTAGLFKDPVNKLEVDLIVLFFMLPKDGEQFIFVGSDKRWFDGDLPLLNLIIDANDGDSDAQRKLGIFYTKKKNYRQAEPYLKAALLAGNISARKPLIALYLLQERLNEAEPYLIQAADDGDVIAQQNLIMLYIVQKKFDQAGQCLERFPLANDREKLIHLLAETRAALAMKE